MGLGGAGAVPSGAARLLREERAGVYIDIYTHYIYIYVYVMYIYIYIYICRCYIYIYICIYIYIYIYMYEKGLCGRRAFLLEKGVYIMLGRGVPNLLVLTSLRRAGFQIWSYLQNIGQQGSKYIAFYSTLSRKFK